LPDLWVLPLKREDPLFLVGTFDVSSLETVDPA